MAFEVQTDVGTLTANSYMSVAEFKSYHDDRGNDFGLTTSDLSIQQALIKATDYLDGRFRFIGERVRTNQRTQWPRLDAEDRWGRLRSGVPFEVKEACAEYALRALTAQINPDPTLDETGRIVQSKREKVDVIETSTEYVSGGAFELPRYPVADNKLRSSGLVVRGVEMRRS